MEILINGVLIIIGIPVGLAMLYVICRIASFAIFKSFAEAFTLNEIKEGGNNGIEK